jgi:hypothetical protein
MKHRSHIPQKERHARSKLAKLLHNYPFVKGALVTSGRTCGKSGCKCSRGEKHLSTYLSVRHKGKRKTICVPKQLEDQIRNSVKTYKDIMELIDIVSDSCVDRLIKSKNTKRLD